MADEDNKNAPDQKAFTEAIGTLRSETDTKLAEITAQLKAQNETFARGFQALMPRSAPEPQIDDGDVLDPRGLRDKILAEANRTVEQVLNEERRKNVTLANLAKEYPEINTDAKFQDSVVEAQKSLPQSIRDTADGYELAVMKAVAKQGILPKSKRTEESDDGYTAPAAASSSQRPRAQSKEKVDDRTLAVAQLLGRNIDDPKVRKGLEEASKRNFVRWKE